MSEIERINAPEVGANVQPVADTLDHQVETKVDTPAQTTENNVTQMPEMELYLGDSEIQNLRAHCLVEEDIAGIEESIEDTLEFCGLPEDTLVEITDHIVEIFEMYQTKVILKNALGRDKTKWITPFSGYLAKQQDSGGWAYVEDALDFGGCRPDLLRDWTLHILPLMMIPTPVWVGWAIDDDNDNRFLAAVWPGAVFSLGHESAWNDWNEDGMKMVWCNPGVWIEESNGNRKMPKPPLQVEDERTNDTDPEEVEPA